MLFRSGRVPISPEETLAKWGHDRILSDMVFTIRHYRPDVIILRFSGTPRDGHGQHQASALLGKEAYSAAADAKRFPEQELEPWKARRLLYNTIAFTPEQEQQAAATPGRIEIDTGAYNPVLGKSYNEIAGISRSQHRSQAMGTAERRGPSKNYLTLVAGDAAKADPFDGVDTTWNRVPNGAAIGQILAALSSGSRQISGTSFSPAREIGQQRRVLIVRVGSYHEHASQDV